MAQGVSDNLEEYEDLFYCDSCDREFVSRSALRSHLSQSSRHPFFCQDCDRDLHDANSFRYHRSSRRHASPIISCPRCSSSFVSVAGFVKHVENSRKCYNLSNKVILEKARSWEDCSEIPNLLTVPRLGGHDSDETHTLISSRIHATIQSFDGRYYVCPVCGKKFLQLWSLDQHLNSNVHDPSEFRCKKCGNKFKELSALVAHVESQKCGWITASSIKGIIEVFKSVLRLTPA